MSSILRFPTISSVSLSGSQPVLVSLYCYRYTTLPFVFDHKLGRVDRDYHSLVVVVSPLISLMIDQVASLKAIESGASIATSGGSVSKALLATEEGLVNCSLLYCVPGACELQIERCTRETYHLREDCRCGCG